MEDASQLIECATAQDVEAATSPRGVSKRSASSTSDGVASLTLAMRELGGLDPEARRERRRAS